jgi:hypothetical protein
VIANLLGIEPVHGRIDFNVDDERIAGHGDGKGGTAMFFLGDDDPTWVGISHYAPGHWIAPHAHASDYMAVVIRGSVTIGGRTYNAGDIRIQEAHSVYGPEHIGDEGLVQVVIFNTAKGLRMDLTRDRDIPTYERLNKWMDLLGEGELVTIDAVEE